MARRSRLAVVLLVGLGVTYGCAQGSELPLGGLGAFGGANSVAAPSAGGAGGMPATSSGNTAAGGAATGGASPSGSPSSSSGSPASSSSTSSSSTTSSGAACAHSDCTTGGKLAASCDPCVAMICAAKPSCCGTSWTATCVNDVATICGLTTCGGTTGTCAHSDCSTSGSLNAACDPCVSNVCSNDPICCLFGWDSICVSEVGQYCGTSCP